MPTRQKNDTIVATILGRLRNLTLVQRPQETKITTMQSNML